MQGENDNIDIKHDMLSKLKALHVMLQDHIPKRRRWEHACTIKTLASEVKWAILWCFLMFCVLLGAKRAA